MDQCIVGGFLLQGCVDKREQIMAVALQQEIGSPLNCTDFVILESIKICDLY